MSLPLVLAQTRGGRTNERDLHSLSRAPLGRGLAVALASFWDLHGMSDLQIHMKVGPSLSREDRQAHRAELERIAALGHDENGMPRPLHPPLAEVVRLARQLTGNGVTLR